MSARMVIIGGGLAAATAAEELRERGFGGEIDVVTAEAHRPYQRPPLSKGFLSGAEGLDAVYVHGESWEDENQVVLHQGNAAKEIADHLVRLDDGTELPFDRLLIATGARPRALPIAGADAPNVHTFRTLDDAEALRAAFSAGDKRVVCVGAGWIGLELAAAARGYGNEVTVVMMEEIPLATALGDDMGSMFREVHEAHGVIFLAGRKTLEIETGADGVATGVRTDRETVPADLVIVGIGAVPAVELAAGAGIEVDHGVLADEHMATSMADVYVAGDAANPLHPVLGERLRSEHWAFAIASAKVAAASMLGEGAVLDDIPYFYTDQFELGMEYSGYAPLTRDATLVIRGDRAAHELIAFWVADGRVVAGMNVNVWDVNDQVQRLIRDRVVVDVARLADSNIPLEEIA